MDPLDLTQWTFYVLPTRVLDSARPTAKSIGLAGLLKLNPTKASFETLKASVSKVHNDRRGQDRA